MVLPPLFLGVPFNIASIQFAGFQLVDHVVGDGGIVLGAGLLGVRHQIQRVCIPVRCGRQPAHAGGGHVVVGQRVALVLALACWRQQRSITAHLVNLNNPMAMRGSYREAIRTGPYRVRMQVPKGSRTTRARLLTAEGDVTYRATDGWVEVEVPHVDFHEVVAIDLI